MKVALFSSTRFGLRCLREAVLPVADEAGIEPVGILTTPPEIRISYSDEPVAIATHVDFRTLEREVAGPVRVERSMDETVYEEVAADWKPDLVLVLGWFFLLPERFRAAVPEGCVGIHASLLPRYRGGAPIPWAIIEGEDETGVTLFYLEEGVDAGDVIGQRRFPVEHEDTCATVYEKATEASIDLLRTELPRLAAGTAPRRAQDPDAATRYPQRSPEDGRIDWARPARRIYDFVRAQTRPYPGAFTEAGEELLTVWSTALTEHREDLEPGRLTVAAGDLPDDRVLVGTATGALRITDCELRGPDTPNVEGFDHLRHLLRTDDPVRLG